MRGLYLSTLFLGPVAYGQSFDPNDANSPGQFGQVGTNANGTSYSNPIMTINAGDPCVRSPNRMPSLTSQVDDEISRLVPVYLLDQR